MNKLILLSFFLLWGYAFSVSSYANDKVFTLEYDEGVCYCSCYETPEQLTMDLSAL